MQTDFSKPPVYFWQRHFATFINLTFILLLSLALTALMVLYLDQLPSQIKVGMPAVQDVIAGQRYEWVDEEATKSSREDAAKNVLAVFDFQKDLAFVRMQNIAQSMESARGKLAQASVLGSFGAQRMQTEEEQALRENFQISLGVVLKDAQYELMRNDEFSEELEKALIGLLDPLQKRLIIDDKQTLLTVGGAQFVFRTLVREQIHKEETLADVTGLLSREEARQFYQEQKPLELQKTLYLDFIDLKKIKIALDVLPEFIKSNVVFNHSETEALKNKARDSVQPIKRTRDKGEIIIRRGEKYEDWHIRVIDGIRKARLESNTILKFFGVFSVILMALIVIMYFADKEVLRFRLQRRDFYFLGFMLIAFMTKLRFGTFVATHMYDTLAYSNGLETFYYLFPVAAGAMVVRYILNAETAFVFAVLLSVFSGMFLDNNMEITVYYLLSGLFAAHLMAQADRRSTVFRHGFYLGLLQIALVTAYVLINKFSTGALMDFRALGVSCAFAFFGGIFSAVVMLVLAPIVESLFSYTTNFQLMELANMNHPLLREMIVRAPGTYHHSQLVGILAEAGARAINANALLAKVGSFYHDIGKMKKPQYFVENQKGYNPHDNLTPSMSALIIDAHVKDGLEMAKEHKLPRLIADFIPEHQGTKLIGFFYAKAKKHAEENNLPAVEEKDYRYIGPKPQSREAGIVMLADTIEAAVRSMPDKAPQKIEASVKKHVDYHFTDGQLDECQLTLKDLNLIVDAFVKILLGIYHQRVEYPENADKTKKPQTEVSLSASRKVADANPQSTSYSSNISPLFKDKT